MSAVVHDPDSLFLFFGMGIQFHTHGLSNGIMNVAFYITKMKSIFELFRRL